MFKGRTIRCLKWRTIKCLRGGPLDNYSRAIKYLRGLL